MITLRRSKERLHARHRNLDIWHSFSGESPADLLCKGFCTLEYLDEVRLPPGTAVPHHANHDAEIITYIHEGSVAYEDSLGRSGVIIAGEFQHLTAARGIRHSEANASRTERAHLFQICLRPAEAELAPSHEQKRFSAAERRGLLCTIASPDGRRGSLRVHQDALIFSAMLYPGNHVVHELAPGRTAWLHLVQGEATVGDLTLTTGDGAGITDERAVSLTAKEETEFLLIDLGADRSHAS